MYKMIVEQLGSEKFRNKYDAKNNCFFQTNGLNLLYTRGFRGIYGWINGFGTPPHKHLDILVPTDKKLNLGERVSVKIIGCFFRNDGDHKIVALEKYRTENDFLELPDKELKMIKAIYPVVNDGEGWFCRDFTLNLIEKIAKK